MVTLATLRTIAKGKRGYLKNIVVIHILLMYLIGFFQQNVKGKYLIPQRITTNWSQCAPNPSPPGLKE